MRNDNRSAPRRPGLSSPFVDSEFAAQGNGENWVPDASSPISETPFVEAYGGAGFTPDSMENPAEAFEEEGGYDESEAGDLFDPAELEQHEHGNGGPDPVMGMEAGPDADFLMEIEGYQPGEAGWDGSTDASGEIREITGRSDFEDTPSYETDEEEEALRGKVPPVRARILWPALGFPAVIAPRDRASTSPFVEGDAAHCICVLVISNRKFLSKEEAARYLRYVPWSARGKRHIPAGQAGSFKEEEIAVRNDAKEPHISVTRPKDRLGAIVSFGGNASGRNGVVANLAHRVREVYRKEGLEYLSEIRVYESAAARLTNGRYQLFWNNEETTEDAPSDEMKLLLRAHAKPVRAKLGKAWAQHMPRLMEEYEYEFGALHAPYSARHGARRTRAEILHPLFVKRNPEPTLKVGQLTDIHIDVRIDVYEENLRQEGVSVSFNNWNKAFLGTYTSAKKDSDVILMTGDIVDYGRGHWGVSERKRLGEDSFYHVDRNWFLYYFLLTTGDSYLRPSYTSLGNHDWRLNPYPPLAISGSPSPASMLNDASRFTDDQQKEILRKAHGPGHEKVISYAHDVESKAQVFTKQPKMAFGQLVRKVFLGQQTADLPKYPTETTVDSIAWYLLSINPFLDYWFTHPSGQTILMLDWTEDENVVFQQVRQGKKWGIGLIWLLAGEPGAEGPKARNCLSDLQTWMVTQFTDQPGPAKIIGIHAPPIGPWDDWYDGELTRGWKTYADNGKARGYPNYSAKTAEGETLKGHPLFAIKPSKGVVWGAVDGMDASYGSFERNRPWFIRRLADQKYGVRLVLSGHIHRRGLFVAYKAAALGPSVNGEMLFRSVLEKEVRGVPPATGALVKIRKTETESGPPPGPLYIVGTSVGPRGHAYAAHGAGGYIDPGYAHAELGNDGTIVNVTFRWFKTSDPATVVTPELPSVPAWSPAGVP